MRIQSHDEPWPVLPRWHVEEGPDGAMHVIDNQRAVRPYILTPEHWPDTRRAAEDYARTLNERHG
jgi:hypothetical protein